MDNLYRKYTLYICNCPLLMLINILNFNYLDYYKTILPSPNMDAQRASESGQTPSKQIDPPWHTLPLCIVISGVQAPELPLQNSGRSQ